MQCLARRIHKNGYTPHSCRAIISKLGWAKHANSVNLVENYIKPYINVKDARRYISYVDSQRERRRFKAAG